MKKPAQDPKTLLAALEGGEAELPFEAAAVQRARELLAGLDGAPADALEALPPPLAEAVLEATVQRRAVAAAERFSSTRDKALVKLAKKALYRLRSAGEAIPEPPRPAAPREVPRVEAPEELPGLLSAITGMGERALIFVRSLRAGGLELYQAVLQDEAGITHLFKHPATRPAYRRQLREVKEGRAPVALELDRARIAQVLGEAISVNLRSRTPFPSGLEELLHHFGATPREPEPIPPPEEGDAALAIEAHTLHDEPELQPWLPPEKELRALAQRMEQVVKSPLELSDAQKGSQLFESFRKAAEEFFTPALKQLYGRRLWAMAELFEKTGRDRQARLARAEARRLVHDAPGLFSRFGEMLFEKVLHLSRLTQQGKPLPEPGKSAPPAEPAEKKLILP